MKFDIIITGIELEDASESIHLEQLSRIENDIQDLLNKQDIDWDDTQWEPQT